MQNFPSIAQSSPLLTVSGSGCRQPAPGSGSGFAEALLQGCRGASSSEAARDASRGQDNPQGADRPQTEEDASAARAEDRAESGGPDKQQRESSGRSTAEGEGRAKAGSAAPRPETGDTQSQDKEETPPSSGRSEQAAMQGVQASDPERQVQEEDLARLLEALRELGLGREERALLEDAATGRLRGGSEAELARVQQVLEKAQQLLKGRGQGEEVARLLESLSAQVKQALEALQEERLAGSQRQKPAVERSAGEPERSGSEARRSEAGPSWAERGGTGAQRAGEGEQGAPGGQRQPVGEKAQAEQLQARSAQGQGAFEQAPGAGSRSGAGGQGGQQDRDGGQAWKELWQKVEKQGPDGGLNDAAARKAFQDRAEAVLQQVLSKAGQHGGSAKGQAEAKGLQQSVFKQVEDGLLRNLGQGKRELTLKLQPPELGSLRVTLQVQGKEVSALIKTSTPETGRMVQQQLSGLQHLLEQQGLKVQNLDVQTSLQQDGSGQQWFGGDSHNQAQEQRQRMERRSWLSKWRQAGGQDGDGPLGEEEASLDQASGSGTFSRVA